MDIKSSNFLFNEYIRARQALGEMGVHDVQRAPSLEFINRIPNSGHGHSSEFFPMSRWDRMHFQSSQAVMRQQMFHKRRGCVSD